MSLRTSAARYAKALFDVAVKEAGATEIERDLAGIVDAVSQHAEFRRLMTSPAVPSRARVDVMRALAEQSGARAPVGKLLAMLAERGRLELLPHLLDIYRQRLLAHGHVVRASVTAATPLASNKVQALAQSLEGLAGKHVQLDLDVDPTLIGGVVARIGSTVYDGSIRTQLQRMKQQLVENA